MPAKSPCSHIGTATELLQAAGACPALDEVCAAAADARCCLDAGVQDVRDQLQALHATQAQVSKVVLRDQAGGIVAAPAALRTLVQRVRSRNGRPGSRVLYICYAIISSACIALVCTD